MSFKLQDLPYPKDELYPYFSQETLTYHHDRHQNAYVQKLNALLENHPDQGSALEQLIQNGEAAVRAQAEQVWNHEFFWTCFKTPGVAHDAEILKELTTLQFGGIDGFKRDIQEAALNHFASGWLWIWIDQEKKCVIKTLPNSENPLRQGYLPILTIDLWEHAYYIDFRNDRKAYIEACFSCLDWNTLSERWKHALESE